MLISELQKDGRKPLSQIAKKLGVSHVAVRKRLKKLLDKELMSVTANLNLEALNA
ncbi:MAG: AsnC family transcriptional regulator, partial [Candidatus Brockarchaeota archaeon]|nr:AsnC family transcriptional regulator [Candidatus Brockarchaeota archaeon]